MIVTVIEDMEDVIQEVIDVDEYVNMVCLEAITKSFLVCEFTNERF